MFEISFREAQYLRIYPLSSSNAEYYKTIADMFRINYRNGLIELQDICEQFKERKEKVTLSFNYDDINKAIKQKYDIK